MTEINPKLLKPYNPVETEEKIYSVWEKSGYFNPDKLPAAIADKSGLKRNTRINADKIQRKSVFNRHKSAFCAIMPPPNANGRLHAGHALDMTLKDVAVRFERMRGKKALFLPGADHAGFETQMVFEKKLAKEGKSRFGMNRNELYNKIYEFTIQNKKDMEDDIRKLGASCDWSRNLFTLDQKVIEKVQDTFIKMYGEGFIYRGSRIVNWNPKFQTSLSDIETEFIEQKDPFYYLQYGPFVIGTVRPETKFGDKYVVMHPKDKRYAKYKPGQKIELEWINGPITATVVKDKSIDMEFGTGVMTITPWHDLTDFEIAERHNLDKKQIIDWHGRLLPIAGEFAGMKIDEARPKIVEKLHQKGLLVKVDENYIHPVRICERTKVKIEPQIKSQWFVKMEPLAKKVIKAVEKERKIKFLPGYQKKILLHWMQNSIDWNISRQIVWGIPIPAWQCEDCDKWIVSKEKPRKCDNCSSPRIRQDDDTFDTWFSSGQWPLLTLDFPDGEDFKTYYPTDLMETGSDLVFKWVPRMVMFGLYLAGEIPFKTVYFHGMVLDSKSQKMSKSKSNVISPTEMTQKFGTDALRMALIVGNTAGGSIALSEDKIKAYKHFANKVWNITRFVIENTRDLAGAKPRLDSYAQKKLNELKKHSKEITKDLENYNFHLAAEKIYQYLWHEFADVIIEESKLRLNNENKKQSAQYLLKTILETELKLLHPFMPFLTEEIWSLLPIKESGGNNLLMVEPWPEKS